MRVGSELHAGDFVSIRYLWTEKRPSLTCGEQIQDGAAGRSCLSDCMSRILGESDPLAFWTFNVKSIGDFEHHCHRTPSGCIYPALRVIDHGLTKDEGLLSLQPDVLSDFGLGKCRLQDPSMQVIFGAPSQPGQCR